MKRLMLTVDGERIVTVSRLNIITSWNVSLDEWRREDVDQLIALLQKLHSTVKDAVMTDTCDLAAVGWKWRRELGE